MADAATRLEELRLQQEEIKKQMKAEEAAAKAELREKAKQEKEEEKKRLKDEANQAKEQLLRDSVNEMLPYIHWQKHLMGDKPVIKYYLRSTLHNYAVTEYSSSDRAGLYEEAARFFSTSSETAQKFLDCKTYFHYSKKPPELRGTETVELILEIAAHTTPELTIEPIALSNNPTECCRTYVDLKSFMQGPTPCWDSFLARVDRPEHFLAFVYSLFVSDDKGRQVCWLRDGGGGGKSTMIRAVTKALGSAIVGTVDCKKLDTNYFFGSVVGKRLIVDPDCQFLHLIGNNRMHNITGGDVVPIERKFHDVVHQTVYAKVLVCSNYYPQISNEKNQESRLLMFDMLTRDGEVAIDLNWEAGMVNEMPFVIAKAAPCYAKLVTNFALETDCAAMDKCRAADHSDILTMLSSAGYKIGEGRKTFFTDMRDLMEKYSRTHGTGMNGKNATFRYGQFERTLYNDFGVSKSHNSSGIGYYLNVGKDGDLDVESRKLIIEDLDLSEEGGITDAELLS